jgi:hypothetical protein
MTMTGNDHFVAVGRVEIRRSDFQAFSNEARMDQVNEQMELLGQSRVQSEQFDLTADRIDMRMPGDRLERIHALNRAALIGDDLRVDAPELQLFFENDELERMIARVDDDASEQRPVATARGFRLEADSLDALTPAQQLERVVAVGNARGEATDTLGVPPGRIEAPAPAGDLASGEHDWIVGDTVTGYFAAVPIPDAGAEERLDVAENGDPQREVRLERIIALGSARSLYRVQNDRPDVGGRPGINYLIGDTIELTFDEGQLQVADVRGLDRGLFLDPEPVPTPDELPDEDDEDPVDDGTTADQAEVAAFGFPSGDRR